MKKLVAIFALFSMMVLTSFTSPNEVGGKQDIKGTLKQISQVDIKNITFEVGGKQDIKSQL